MSYSFGVRGHTKALALDAAEAEFKKVVASQPTHALDEAVARKHREEVSALVGEPPEGKDFYLSCSGSVSWTGTYPDSHRVVSVSCSVASQYVDKEEAKA